MADTPTPRSYPQTLGDMFDAFLSKQGIKSLRVGGPIVSLLEAAAQSDMRNAQDIFNLLTSADLDNATGLALSRIGRNEGVPKLEITPATGTVNIVDSSFTKKATTLFQGSPAPIVGTGTVVPINVVDASQFPAPGPNTKIYIGRGTSNYEGPIRYTNLVDVGGHWEVTLATPTTKFHNTTETVILAQGGNRVVGPNTAVRTPQASVASAISFRTLYPVTLPDGETEIDNVQVAAELGGLIGNVIAGAISEFATLPFTGATVANSVPYTNGRETESDDDYRERIRDVRASRQLATTLAITTAVTGITAPDENRRINSASLVKRFGFPSTLYVDDGTGYEERTAAIAVESLMDDATGGETHFETTQRPIARGFAISTNTAPFVLRATDQLTVRVGGIAYTHIFSSDDFHSISNASAYEVVASINSNPDIAFVARTANQGSQVVVFANVDVNEDVEVVENTGGTNANDGLQFPAGVNYTMRLYKNDRLLSKDGETAVIQSLPQSAWDSVSGGKDFVIAIDNTPAITYTFQDQDFIDANTGYATLGRNSLAAWAAVINAKIPGITATVNAGRLVLTSNSGPSEKAAVEIIGGDLVAAHFFNAGKVVGRARDYTLDRNEAQVVLMKILEAGDRLTAGSYSTRAFVESDAFETINIAADAHLWWLVDGNAQIIKHGLSSSTPVTLSVQASNDYGNVFAFNASPTVAFQNVQAQDWVILWDSSLPASIRGVHRIASVAADHKSFTIERHETNVTMRHGHRSVLIPGVGTAAGKVFTCGGNIVQRNTVEAVGAMQSTGNIATAELYDHNTKTVTPAAPMSVERVFHTATVLANGKVVVVGGSNSLFTVTKTIEIYNPSTDSWTLSAHQLTTARQNHTATLLTDGRILIAGGDNGSSPLDSYQVYDPGADTIGGELHMIKHRTRHSAVKLPDNSVLLAGGYDSGFALLTHCERFVPGPDTTTVTGAMNSPRAEFGLGAPGASPTNVIAIGNAEQIGTDTNTYEIYTIGTGLWTGLTTVANFRYATKNVVKVSNGDVVGLDGKDTGTPDHCIGFKFDGTTFTPITSQSPAVVQLPGGARYDTQLVEIVSGDGTTVKNLIATVGGSFYHSTDYVYQPTAILNVYNEAVDTWSAPDPGIASAVPLVDGGITFVRSNAFIQKTTVPAGSNYTASSLADTLGAQLTGATPSVYKTQKLRVATNTFDATGDISLASQDLNAAPMLLSTEDAVANLVPHLGAVMSGNSDLGTPSFEDVRVVSQESDTGHTKPVVTSGIVGYDYAIVGLKNWLRGGPRAGGGTWSQERANSNYKFATRFATRVTDTALLATLTTRDAPPERWGGWDRVAATAPFAISPNGLLDVLIDNDQNKRFPISLWRNLQTVGNVYASTNTFKDADQAGEALSQTFGLGYDFNDMAVYMPSRALAFSADANRRMLFRYFRLGPDGDGVGVRFGNPDTDTAQLKAVTVMGEGGTAFQTTIKLKSGAARTPTVHNTTQVGKVCIGVSTGGTATFVEVLNLAISSATRASTTVTLTVTNPPTVTNHGIAATAKVWVQSSDSNFPSGLKTVSAVTGTTIQYTEAGTATTVANIGTVSYDNQGEATYTGSGTVQYDYLRVVDPTNTVAYGNITFQISSVPAGGHYIEHLSGDQYDGSLEVPATTLIWTPIANANYFKIFANSPQTAASAVSDINALRAATGSTCPISAFETGSGSGNIVQNTCDELDNSTFFYRLSDGINWVQTTTSPGVVPLDYTLTFKAPISSSLSANADWQHETVRIVPITTQNLVEWLNTPTVTGLWTVAEIEEAGEGHHLEISTLTGGSNGGVQVQGGVANAVTAPVVGSPLEWSDSSGNTISLLDSTGLHTNHWCRIQNENPQPKLGNLDFSTLQSWTADGLITLDVDAATEAVTATPVIMQFEKQGNFVAIADVGSLTNPFGSTTVHPGQWIRITPAPSITDVGQVSAANQGLFRVVRFADSVNANGGTIYIENSGVIEETSAVTVQLFDIGSAMPGDQLVVLDSTWGAGNIGVWDIKAVGETTVGSGDMFTVLTQLTVDTSSRTPVPHGLATTLTGAGNIYVREGLPMVYVQRIAGLTLNQDDGNFVDLKWDKQVFAPAGISAGAGSVIQVLDKLEFPQGFAAGADGYRYDVGLLREANKVIYGDPANPATYPGVAAADSHINIQGPLVKRIQVGVSVRVKTGLRTKDIENRVRSAVATVINQTPIGTSISFSDIIDAARAVVGVISVAIASPLFTVESDQIKVQPYEKPFVLDLSQDIQVSFIGA
jgi:hypothetical protein